ncbi:uncharacterized protein EV420DRAFT_1478270 [Desarmillaria tabescens]|uniref:Uncharacterized protein n=1 Tax=Armillaria tabescens TaxID=1929756 RepID=A0AA39N7J9_ARMTA|nr:uncharacterized protein EV420DRAFT_1478270 [Desarmillaria tabescens]KAK0460492.1 hypothetical protein EV420DRAFT_1478270 [Desarmillaria tabescens]
MPAIANTTNKKTKQSQPDKQLQHEKHSGDNIPKSTPHSKRIHVAGGEPEKDNASDKTVSEDENLTNDAPVVPGDNNNTTTTGEETINTPNSQFVAIDVSQMSSAFNSVNLPFFANLLAGKVISVLPCMKEVGVSYGDPDPCVITPVVLAHDLTKNEDKARRILKFAFDAQGHNMQNLFSASPRHFKYLVVNPKNEGHKIVYSKNNKDVTFFIVGKVTYCSLATGEYNKEINIQPLGRQWPCCIAVIAQVLKFNNPVMGTYKDGMMLSSYQKPAEGGKEPTIKKILVDGFHHGPPICAWNEEVPMYARSDAFTLTNYSRLARTDEFEVGSYVLVAFTIGGYCARDDLERVSLNIQFTIGLEDHSPLDVGDVTDAFVQEFGDETPLGIDNVTPMALSSETIEAINVEDIPAGPMM